MVFLSSSFRWLGKRTTVTVLRNNAPNNSHTFTWRRSMTTESNHKVKTSNSLKMAVSVSGGLILLGALDFVAPRDNPFDPINKTSDDYTYWQFKNKHPIRNDNNTSNDSHSTTTHVGRPPLVASVATSANNNIGSVSPEKYRVVIIGGGLAGLHTALALSERQSKMEGPKKSKNVNSNIIILDSNEIGAGASGKSKGLAVPGVQVPEENLANKVGSKEIAGKVVQLTYQALDRLRNDIVKKYKINCDWVDAGLLEASLHEEEDDHDDNDKSDHTDESDGECVELTAAQTRKMLGQPESSTLYKCGEFYPSCSGLDPLALTRGLANVVEKVWGVRICEHTTASRIEKIAPPPQQQQQQKGTETDAEYKYVVTTESGAQIQCQHVVLCTGPSLVSKELSQRLNNAIVPIYTWMASTAPLGDKCPLQGKNTIGGDTADTTRQNIAPLCGDDYVCLNYWRRTDDGRLLFGSIADAYPMPRWLAEARLRRCLKEVYPQLADVPFEHIWGGTLALSRDAVPLIGRDEGFDDQDAANNDSSKGGVWYATGFGGHGIVPTAMAGSVIADGILGIDDETWRLFHREFPPKYIFWPVSRLGAQSMLTVYNVFDWLHVKGVPVPRLPKPW